MTKERKYTCLEYREEMRLLGLKRRLDQEDLSEQERAAIMEEIQKLEASMEMD
jgi:hypothetical protein